MSHRISISFLFFFSLVLLSSFATASNFGYDTEDLSVDPDFSIFIINDTELQHANLTGLQG